MTPPTEPDRRPDRPLRLTTTLRPAPPGWRRRLLGPVPGAVVTLAMFAAALGAGRLGGRLLRSRRDAVLDERVRFATPPAPRPVARPLPSRPGGAATTPPATPAAPATTTAGTPPTTTAPTGDTGTALPPGSRLRAAERAARAALGMEIPPPLIGAPRPAVPGRVGASRIGAPLTGAQKDSLIAAYRQGLVARGMWPLFPDATDRARSLDGSNPAELTTAQRNDLARAGMAADVERTPWVPCAYSPGAQMPGGRSANAMRVGCRAAEKLFPAAPTADGPRVTVAPLGVTIKLSKDGEAALAITPLGIAGRIGIPGSGPSRAQRARDAARDAENRRILARIRDRTRRRTDSLSWIAESTRAARDSAGRASVKPPG